MLDSLLSKISPAYGVNLQGHSQGSKWQIQKQGENNEVYKKIIGMLHIINNINKCLN